MNFADNVDIYFDEIKNIPRLFAYCEILDRLSGEDGQFSEKWIGTILENNFTEKNLTDRKVEILTFLLLESDGYFGELIADKYIKLFDKSSELFLRFLSKTTYWKRVVDLLESGDFDVFGSAVKELGDSGFERELKRYVIETFY